MAFRVILFSVLVILILPSSGTTLVHITHEYANVDAQSAIGLPMGSEKTIIDQVGNLRWSQWSIRRREPEVPFGISRQMDGALDLRLAVASPSGPLAPFKAVKQELYRGRFPFVETRLEAPPGLAAEELAFPTAIEGAGLDVVRITVTNRGSDGTTVEAHFSGKMRNNPAFAEGNILATRDARLVVLGEAEGCEWGPEKGGLILKCRTLVPPNSSCVIWLKRPHDMRVSHKSVLLGLAGSTLLEQAERSWQEFWEQGLKVELPEKEVIDFLYSSLACLFILTEYDAQGDLWTLDGPTVYRHFWPRSEYYMGLGMEMSGHHD